MSDHIEDLANKVIQECRSEVGDLDWDEVEGLAVELLDQRKRNRRLERDIEHLNSKLLNERGEIATRLMAGMLVRGPTQAEYAVRYADELLAEVTK